jgi:dTDP-glucose 4,6-dehydratase
MPTLLVTGGAGFIGGTFVRCMIDRGDCDIVNLDKLTYAGNLESIVAPLASPRHTFVHGDISDATLLRRIFTQWPIDAVVHFAAESHVDRSIGAPESFVRTNVVGTCELLAAALTYWESLPAARRDAFRFLHVSTDEVYGSLGPDGYFVESTRYAPNSPYSASKAASDHFVRAYYHTYGLPVVTTNCSINYGPYQFPEKLIPLMILNALEGKPLPVYGNGQNIRDWLHVEDHVAALRIALDRGAVGEVYNIGGRCELSNLEVVQAICRAVDELRPDLAHRPCEQLIRFVADRPGHDFRYAIDSSKLETELGWKPARNFAAGIRETVRWYLENKHWVSNIHSGRYQRERLGLRRACPADSQQSSARPMAAAQSSLNAEAAIAGVEFRPLKRLTDARGWLVELFRADELIDALHPAMAYFSQSEPGVVRGPHEHVDQTDYFAFIGPGDFKVTLWDARAGSLTQGRKTEHVVGASAPSAIIIPPGVVHAYQNISDVPGWVFNAPNRLYAGRDKCEPVDEIRHEVDAGSPYQLRDVQRR